MTKIKLILSTKGINEAIKQLKQYQKSLEQKANELAARLAYIGAKEASIRFTQAAYDSPKDINVDVVPIKNGWRIEANGEAICFIEFGAGVYYNGTEPYPDRPSEVKKIGEFGNGKGKKNSWFFTNENGKSQFTHGTPAAMPMYNATKEMRKEIVRIAREVFK